MLVTKRNNASFVGEYIAQHIPRAQLQLLDATGHFPPIGAPEQVTRAILDFV